MAGLPRRIIKVHLHQALYIHLYELVLGYRVYLFNHSVRLIFAAIQRAA